MRQAKIGKQPALHVHQQITGYLQPPEFNNSPATRHRRKAILSDECFYACAAGVVFLASGKIRWSISEKLGEIRKELVSFASSVSVVVKVSREVT